MAVCNHPYCTKTTKRAHCGRHWYALPEDLQVRIRRAKSPSDKGALLAEARAWFEERMIGRHEITTCRGRPPNYDNGCGAEIVWLTTKQNKKMPVDAASVERDDDFYEPGRHVPHWSTCPNAKEFKRP